MKEYILDKITELLDDAEKYIKSREELRDLYDEVKDLAWSREQAVEWNV